ncbi:MAG: AbrB family transcriptional regulator [Methylobacterium mesophilicum]|nr:AbrB family transcriptional regulator [Methylobacterium mesophilicum]
MPRPAQWALLLALSVFLAFLINAAGLPAALLLGPMIAAIVSGVNGAAIRPRRPFFWAGQAVVGVLIASSIEWRIVQFILADWPLIGGAVVATIAASSILGYGISRWTALPGTTGVWGSAPGAASAMVLMAETFGADARLVAFMQYLRVIMVSGAAALVAGFWVDTSTVAAPPPVPWFPPVEPQAFAATLGVALAGSLLGRLLRLPTPFLLGSMIVGIALHLGLDLSFQLPQWLLGLSYAVIGWTIGLNFTRPVLLHAARALPQVIGSILTLMAFCGGIAFLLTRLLGLDPLTAYLATSPGGMDSVAIIAAASGKVDLSFVMALQMARFLFVLLVGPPLARFVSRAVKE